METNKINIIGFKRLRMALQGVIVLLVVCSAVEVFAGSSVAIDLNKIAIIESSGNPLAYNRNSGATGMYQIMPIVVKEYNNTFRSDLRVKDMFNSEIALTVSNWYINSKIPEYFRIYKIKDTVENRLWAYNAGIGLLKKGIKPLETRKYIAKYNKLSKGVK